MSEQTLKQAQVQSWWKFGHVWMVLAGPAIVVVASCFTFYLAASSPDPVLEQGGAQVSGAEDANALAPAIQARNHAATGIVTPGAHPQGAQRQ